MIGNPFTVRSLKVFLDSFVAQKFHRALHAAVYVIVGMWVLLKKDFAKYFLLISIFFTFYFASVFRIYPFFERTILLLVPIILILMAAGIYFTIDIPNQFLQL